MTHEEQPIKIDSIFDRHAPAFGFSPDTKDKLQKRGYVVLKLDYTWWYDNNSTWWYEDGRIITFKDPHVGHAVEVAFSPNFLHLPIHINPATSINSISEGYESIKKYSGEVSRQFSECSAVEGSYYFSEMSRQHKKLTGKELPEKDPYRMMAVIVPAQYKAFLKSPI
jgi:hypothetical protein